MRKQFRWPPQQEGRLSRTQNVSSHATALLDPCGAMSCPFSRGPTSNWCPQELSWSLLSALARRTRPKKPQNHLPMISKATCRRLSLPRSRMILLQQQQPLLPLPRLLRLRPLLRALCARLEARLSPQSKCRLCREEVRVPLAAVLLSRLPEARSLLGHRKLGAQDALGQLRGQRRPLRPRMRGADRSMVELARPQPPSWQSLLRRQPQQRWLLRLLRLQQLRLPLPLRGLSRA